MIIPSCSASLGKILPPVFEKLWVEAVRPRGGCIVCCERRCSGFCQTLRSSSESSAKPVWKYSIQILQATDHTTIHPRKKFQRNLSCGFYATFLQRPSLGQKSSLPSSDEADHDGRRGGGVGKIYSLKQMIHEQTLFSVPFVNKTLFSVTFCK